MTAKEFLSNFSETLLQDEQILSRRERELLSNLLQRARAEASSDQESAVPEGIARAVGETVAQRAFTVLGKEIVQHVMRRSEISIVDNGSNERVSFAGPQPPAGPQPMGPQPPGPKPGPQPPKTHWTAHMETALGYQPPSGPQPAGPQPPGPKPGPQPPKHAKVQQTAYRVDHPIQQASVTVMERPEFLAARCVALEEFLSPSEVTDLIQYTLDHESDFEISEVISPGVTRSGGFP